jgi:uncharacterized protein
MLLLRGARAASAASTAVAAGASAGRCISIRLTAVAALSSGGRRRKGQRRGEAKPPSPSPLPPPPQPLPRHGETPSSKKKSGSRPSFDAKKNRPAELEQARGPRSPERGEARKGGTQQQQQEKAKAKRAVRWKCASGCGACCKLDKGPDFPTPDEIFADHPDDLQVGPSTTSASFSIREKRECFLIKDARFRSIRAWNLLLCANGATDGDDVGHACSCTGA